MKRILDTVHGYIMVDDQYITHIIDTTLFQRLRRIEQTSIRAVYPCARHDRFIHSLGVFHIGSMIVERLKNIKENTWGVDDGKLENMFVSYLCACLLHDIGHAPFSHTFEEYYGQKTELGEQLCSIVNSKEFRDDYDCTIKSEEPNFHEFMSAIIAFEKFGGGLNSIHANPELVVRMITGIYYNVNKKEHQIDNCLISLLHGNVIDADRLDYACRDVWASGYSTSCIDLKRLISALHIKKNVKEEFVVCFESNSINEINGVLNVKDFQNKYVINHHSVCYEQWLLRNAVIYMAKKFFNEESSGEMTVMNKIFNKDSILNKTEVAGKYTICNISDDDIIFLLKQCDDNCFYKEWASRQYTRYPLWKSKDEFLHFFKLDPDTDFKHNRFRDEIKKVIEEKKEITDVIVLTAEFKPRVCLKSLYLVVSDDIVRYTDIYKNSVDDNKNITFYYVYVSKREQSRGDWEKERGGLISDLQDVIKNLYN